jgi:hypothetical protein
MAVYRKPRWSAVTAGYAVFLLVLGAFTAFVCENSTPAHQPFVIRLAVASLVAVVVLHLRRYFRDDPLWDPPSAFAAALTRDPPAPKLHPQFVRLRDEIVQAMARRSAFERTLWPRLAALAQARGGNAASVEPPVLPRRRGPSPGELAALLDRIENRP